MTHKSTLQSNHGGVVLIGVVEVLQLHIWAKIKGLNRREMEREHGAIAMAYRGMVF